jgi:protein-L-isoaspartate O-methyltransferase
VLHCKPGLAQFLVDDLRARTIEARAEGDHAVHITLAAPWATLFGSRLWTSAGIRVPRPGGDSGDALVASIVAGLTAPSTRALLAAWTRGPMRWRLELPEGKQRAVVWRVAREVTAAAPELVNDPTATAWDIRLAGATALELIPRRAPDPRFAYRAADVPAASHPTVAAALARVAEPRAGDRVWDPFCGSGLELVECAQLARVVLAGTDLDERALAAARANLAAAQLEATLVLGDSRAAAGAGDLDLVITNPPLGSRVQVDAAALLVAVLPVIARRLARGGRLVWITPAPQQTTRVAEGLGLRRTFHTGIDLGGVRGRLERWQR